MPDERPDDRAYSERHVTERRFDEFRAEVLKAIDAVGSAEHRLGERMQTQELRMERLELQMTGWAQAMKEGIADIRLDVHSLTDFGKATHERIGRHESSLERLAGIEIGRQQQAAAKTAGEQVEFRKLLMYGAAVGVGVAFFVIALTSGGQIVKMWGNP